MVSDFKSYPFDCIERKWQEFWEKNKTFKSSDPGEKGSEKPKFYILDMFPYPSGSGLHVGHLEGYTATDILARYKRMKGFNVLHPMGWDAFGLPAEQYALETGTHPKETTQKNIQTFKKQIKQVGFSYDWDREIDTTDSNYYKWTQWIFTKLFEKGLAYEAEIAVNWCPELGTVLANEEVIEGKSERGSYPVIKKPMRQWVLKITAYAERLLEDLDILDWSEAIKEMQRNWIGKSVGADVDFSLENSEEILRVFTTRPDTLFGATYMVLAPEHPLAQKITIEKTKKAISDYIKTSQKKSDLERTELAKTKTGVFTGAYAINPVNQKKIPIWISDYVLISYGTGAIMAVPAHDERDFEFATKFKLPIVPVIQKTEIASSQKNSPRNDVIASEAKQSKKLKVAFVGDGINFNSTAPDGKFSIDNLPTEEAKGKIIKWLENTGKGKGAIQYKLRDWLFSRQRYWGEPFPVIHKDGKPCLVSEKELPVKLPEVESYKPTGTGESPLAGITQWVEIKDSKTGKTFYRETNTMPQWAGSCWYYLRYIDPQNNKALVDPQKEKYWMPVDLYVGGAEHAVLHLLYARFWHKVLFDLGIVSTKEPFGKLTNQGMILGEDGQKMSKSRGNVVNQEEIIKHYGADSVRLYEMFMGPLEMTKPWAMTGVEGVYRFLGKTWRLFMDQTNELKSSISEREATEKELKLLHKTIKKVTDDLEALRFNTAISALMIFINEAGRWHDCPKNILKIFILLLAPFTPHIAEELWQTLGSKDSLAYEQWPKIDEKYLVEDSLEMAILVGGKVKTKMVVSRDCKKEEIEKKALDDDKVKDLLKDKKIKQIIVVPGRIVNIVVDNA